MNPPIITRKASRKSIRRRDNQRETLAFAQYNPDTKQHTITIPYRASTKTRLHEIAHCELGHCIKILGLNKMTIKEYMEQEIDAEEWAFSKCGKLITLDVVINHARSLIIDLDRRTCPVFSACIKAMTKHGYNLDREQRSELWWQCREFEKERREY